MRILLATALAATILTIQTAKAQGILPELMYGVYALDDSCDVNARRMIITPTDILLADPGLDIRIHYPDQTKVTGDAVALNGNFFVSVVYDGTIKRTDNGALMSFNFPDLSFPLLEPILKSVFSGEVPTAVKASLNLENTHDSVVMTLSSDDVALSDRLGRAIGTWSFADAQIIRTLPGSSKSSVYPRCYDGKTANAQHAATISGKTGVYALEGKCTAGSEAFVIAEDGWGLAIPFGDPTIGYASSTEGNIVHGELYRAPFAPLAPNENSYMDIGVRDGAISHALAFESNGFTWTRLMGKDTVEEAGLYQKCAEVGGKSFSEIVDDIESYLNE